MGKLTSGTTMISLLSLLSYFVNLTTGYQGWNHFICMFTPLTGGTLIKFHRDLEGSARPAWSVVFDLHRFLDLALHIFFFCQFPWRVCFHQLNVDQYDPPSLIHQVDHLASLVSH